MNSLVSVVNITRVDLFFVSVFFSQAMKSPVVCFHTEERVSFDFIVCNGLIHSFS